MCVQLLNYQSHIKPVNIIPLLLEKQLTYLIVISTGRDIREGNRYLSNHSEVINSKDILSVGPKPLKHLQFPDEGHAHVLIYPTGSGLVLHFSAVQL